MTEKNPLARLEAFSDGVFAIAITLLILEIKIPETIDFHTNAELLKGLISLWSSWFSFILTFITLLIAWTNHHNTVKQLDKNSPLFIYTNGFLMLTVIVFPFSAGLLSRFLNTELNTIPAVLYCFTTFVHGMAWLAFDTAAISPKDLTIDATHKKKIKEAIKVIAVSCIFNLFVTIIATWFPIIAISLVSSAWIVYLIKGSTVLNVE